MALIGVWTRTSGLLGARLQGASCVGRSVSYYYRCGGGSPAIPGPRRAAPARQASCARSPSSRLVVGARTRTSCRSGSRSPATRIPFLPAVSAGRPLSSKSDSDSNSEARDADAENADSARDGSLPQLDEAEWDHPAVRGQDKVLSADPELRSLLCEIASDFGRTKPAGGDGDGDGESSTVVEEPGPASTVVVEQGFVAVTTEDHEMGVDEEKDFRQKECDSGSAESETCLSAETAKDGGTKASHVFSVEDLVGILQAEKALDICVIRVPPEKEYVDYFVVVTGRSGRHLSAMTQRINQLYKEKKGKGDPFLNIEGKLTRDWMCLDFGNVVVHFMLEETRTLYDLEALWTLGKDHDDHMTLWDQQLALFSAPETEPEPQSTAAGASPISQDTQT